MSGTARLAMTVPADPLRPAAILARLGLTDGGEAVVLASRRPAAVLWASEAALARFGVDDAATLTRTLFALDGAASAFAERLARLPDAGSYRLERILLPGQTSPVVVACHPVADDTRFVALLHLRVPGSAVQAPPATPAVQVTASAAADPRPDQPMTRILWETDSAGVVTRIDAEARCLGPKAPRLGDDLPHGLRPFAPELADRIAAAAQARGSVGLLRFAWPVDGNDTPLAVDAGCTAKRGDAGGLRGFFTVHGAAGEPIAMADLGAAPDTATGPDTRPGDNAPTIEHDLTTISTEALVEAEPPMPEPEPPPSGASASNGSGNVVHFPIMRLGPVPANFVAALRPAPPSATSDFTDLAAPQWSETPSGPAEPAEEEPEGLSASERDAFEHIRQVLGTRPFTAAAAPQPVAPTSLPPGLPQLLDRIPAGLRLDLAGAAYANAALRDRLGPDAAAALSGRTDLNDLTAQDGTPIPAEVVSFDMDGTPAALTIVPSPLPGPQPEPGTTGATEMLDLVTDGHLRLDDAGTVLALSPRGARLLGIGATDALGRPFASFLAEGQAPVWQALAAAATGPEALPQGPTPLRLRGGAGQVIAVQARLGRSGGTLLCAVTLDRPAAAPANDTVEAARLEAERTSALKSEFLAKVSHEIRTPLNAILGFTEVIRDERLGPVGNARYLEYLRDIHASGTHVMSLVNDLLDLSRIEAGRMDLNLEAVDSNAIVQACVNTLQTEAHRERVIVRLSLTPRLPPTLADERSLRQIVLNLLSNAIKFNEPGGQVIVSTALARADAVAIRIRDTGIGMNEDEIAAAMEPFRQLSTVNRTGSGLGLPLTKALVEANCASMTVKSSRGEGTLVEVTFPLVEQGSVSLPAE